MLIISDRSYLHLHSSWHLPPPWLLGGCVFFPVSGIFLSFARVFVSFSGNIKGRRCSVPFVGASEGDVSVFSRFVRSIRIHCQKFSNRPAAGTMTRCLAQVCEVLAVSTHDQNSFE